MAEMKQLHDFAIKWCDKFRDQKIKPKSPPSKGVEYLTWDYSEKLVLDRQSETLEHIQNIGTGQRGVFL